MNWLTSRADLLLGLILDDGHYANATDAERFLVADSPAYAGLDTPRRQR